MYLQSDKMYYENEIGFSVKVNSAMILKLPAALLVKWKYLAPKYSQLLLTVLERKNMQTKL